MVEVQTLIATSIEAQCSVGLRRVVPVDPGKAHAVAYVAEGSITAEIHMVKRDDMQVNRANQQLLDEPTQTFVVCCMKHPRLLLVAQSAMVFLSTQAV